MVSSEWLASFISLFRLLGCFAGIVSLRFLGCFAGVWGFAVLDQDSVQID